jgi:DNA (cytosine-5)-methyltransferase 1
MDVTEEVTATLRAEANHPPIVLESHPADGRIGIEAGCAIQTLTTRMGSGGGNVPLLLDTPKTLKVRCGKEGGGKGALVQDDISATLSCRNDQTLFAPVVYGICSKGSHAMQSGNPVSGFYEAMSARTLDANGGSPSCNQGGMAVVAVQGSMIGRKDSSGPQGSGTGKDVSFTLNTVDRHAVAYSMSKNSRFTHADTELAASLVATDCKDPPVVGRAIPPETRYVVRRLTPTECARLQGFPDWWCDGLGTENPSESEIDWWRKVFITKARIEGRMARPRSDGQIRKWLRDPYSDSAAYRMWGNGVALPNAAFVLSGIAREASADTGE